MTETNVDFIEKFETEQELKKKNEIIKHLKSTQKIKSKLNKKI